MILKGIKDGLDQPYYLSVGMSYPNPVTQWLYDQGSILGQRIIRVRDAWRRGEGQ